MKEIEKISLFYEISQALNEHLDMEKSLYRVMAILADQMNMVRGNIALLNALRDEISMIIAHGISRNAMQKARYKTGEGVIGEVISSGKPLTVLRISQEPRFLNRTASRTMTEDQEFSFICVPIKKGQQVIGALSVDRPFEPGYSLAEGKKILTVVATMIARHVINLEHIRAEKERLEDENKRLRDELERKYSFSNIIGSSNKMREVFQMISRVSKSNATVILRGESGTGKELVANAIHYNSERMDRPFVKVNCAAIPENLIESELFGHEKGAFTGAHKQTRGKFEVASKGTIFLDEIGSLNPDAQAKLLRVLQEKEFERIGGHQVVKTDVRVIAATNKNLEDAVESGSFREDLYYRLCVFPIFLPPLRERKTDISLLAEHFLGKYVLENNRKIKRLSTPVIDMLMDYHWPGNVRELENCIERSVLMADGEVLHGYHLPPTLQTGEQSNTLPTRTLDEAVAAMEREMLIDALKNNRGNISHSADMLGTTVRKFSYKANKYGINYKNYR
ncbi:MAG: sigma-54 interaction domain-containing protein [Thermodesulfobacteriota bacterium]